MKRSVFLLFAVVAVLGKPVAGNRVVENPACELNACGIVQITKVELTKQATRVHVRYTSYPGWSAMFSDNTCIRDSGTGKIWKASGAIGVDLGGGLSVPESGDTTVIVVFPALDRAVKKIDYLSEWDRKFRPLVYGISLESRKSRMKEELKVPSPVREWLCAVTSLQDHPHRDTSFFRRDTTRLVGYIKGYDSRLGFSSGILTVENKLTEEFYPAVVRISPDGRFEAPLVLPHPQIVNLSFLSCRVPVYIVPGETLSMILDWQECLKRDRVWNMPYRFRDIVFGGTLGAVNQDLLRFRTEGREYDDIMDLLGVLEPSDFLIRSKIRYEQNVAELEQVLQAQPVSSEADRLLRNSLLIRFVCYLFEYAWKMAECTGYDTADSCMMRMPGMNRYYDFLQQLPLDDPYWVADPLFARFVARFEYNNYFDTPAMKEMEKNRSGRSRLAQWQMKDSILTHALHLKPNLMYEILKLRSLKHTFFLSFGNADSHAARSYVAELGKGISDSFLRREAERLYETAFPQKLKHEELPEGKAADLFREIIAPFRGKVVFVDFWSTTCSRCMAHIRQMKDLREKYRGNPDFEFVFITSDEASPSEAYKKFADEQDLEHTYRISTDTYNYFCQLFRFIGIPHYVVIDREGRLIDRNFDMRRFEASLGKILEKE